MFLLLSTALALDPDGDHHLMPSRGPDAARIASWPSSGGWQVGPARSWSTGGSRFGALVVSGAEASIEVQGLGAGRQGPWVAAETTWSEGPEAVRVVELGAHYPSARIRVRGPVDRIDWEIRVPADEPRGRAAPRPPGVSSALADIGVVDRETWGSRSTNCTTTEDDWYRFAIHHTAGSQTSSGTVQGSVQALQAYAMDSGGYCDIPYQFVVGYDGSLWEGRPLDYYSGATGSGNNDGNIAVCFLGCYDASGCGSSYDDATDDMIVWARLLIQTLAQEHGIVTDDDTTRGHGDWPDQSTACPGSEVKARLDELREADAPFQAAWLASSDTTVEVALGDEVEVTIELENTGSETWTAGHVYLAPTPRDEAVAWAGSDWPSVARAATVSRDVSPGDTGSFTFSVHGDTVGTHALGFGLVAEWTTWFEDIPWGGGPSDGDIGLTLVVDEAAGPTGSEEEHDDDGSLAGPPLGSSMTRVPLSTMGRCGVVAVSPWWALALLGCARRRRSG